MLRFIPKPSSPTPEATDSQDKIEVSSGGDKVTYKWSETEEGDSPTDDGYSWRKYGQKEVLSLEFSSETEKIVQIKERSNERQATWTTEGDSPTDDGYSWRKYGQKMTLSSKFPRSYYRCIHRKLGCLALKQVQQLSSDPPRYTTIYRGKHNCKNPPKTPQITHQSSPIPKFDPSILLDSGESSINNATLKTMLPYGSYPSYGHGHDFQCSIDDMNDCYSIFFLLPEDYEFEEDSLIQLWMAGKYIKDEHIGKTYFRLLLNWEYMVHSGTNFVTKKDRYRVKTRKVKALLDVQDDNASFYLKWENGCQDNNMTDSTKIKHVSLVCNEIDATIFQTLEQLNELRTLLFLHSYGNKVTQIPAQLFQSCKKLQALDLSRTHIRKLPSSVGCMIHLHYLDLSWTLIEWLPDIICSLVELQTLKLRGCSKLRGLPSQLKRLIKLRHLDVDVLRQLATLPKGIGALVNLITLSAFLVGTEEGCKIQELKDLNNLTGDFCIAMLENVGNGDEAKGAELNHKQYLNKLELRWTTSQLLRTNNNCYDVLNCLQPCSSLKELQIFCYEGSSFPSWVGGPILNQLVSITFFKCENVSELPLIEQLPCLKHLELVKMNGVNKIERRGKAADAAFFRLEKLEINEMQSLEAWSWVKTNEDDFISLVELTINDCPELQEFHVLSCLSSIKHLEIRECLKLESLSETKLPDSLEDLVVEDCPRIKKKCLQQGGEDWYKIQHVSNIRICTEDDDDDDDDDDDHDDE